jgi:hypothetical protein
MNQLSTMKMHPENTKRVLAIDEISSFISPSITSHRGSSNTLFEDEASKRAIAATSTIAHRLGGADHLLAGGRLPMQLRL